MFKQKQYWSNNSIYFLTTSTFLHTPYFSKPEQKQIIYEQFKKLKEKYNVKINAYSIAINHFHIKFYIKNGLLIPKIKQILHGGTSFLYKKKYSHLIKNTQLWQSTKLLQVTSEIMDWRVTGYINGNLLKHKEVSTFEELKNNKFSSYWYYAQKYGDQDMQESVRSVINIAEDNKGFMNINDFASAMPKLKFFNPSPKGR